jgi:hypothetical protein
VRRAVLPREAAWESNMTTMLRSPPGFSLMRA